MRSETAIEHLARNVADEFYDAVFDPTAWARAVKLIEVEAPELRPIVMIETWDGVRSTLLGGANMDAEMLRRYLDGFQQDNALRPSRRYAAANRVALTTDYISQAEFVRTRTYGDLLRPFVDVRVASANILHADNHAFAALAFHYDHREQAGSLPLGMMLHRLLAAHAERAFALALRAGSLRRKQRAEDTLACLEVAALVVDDAGRLIRMNERAETLIRETGIIELMAGGMPTAGRPEDARQLETAVMTAAKTKAMATARLCGRGGRKVEVSAMPLVRKEASDPLVGPFLSVAEPAAILYLTPVG